jgi:glutamate-1-semialdehyde 2,1-aminomutase
MDRLAPDGDVYQAGTLSGNPVAVAAGLATMELIDGLNPYPALRDTATALREGISEALTAAGVSHRFSVSEPLFSVFFGDRPVRTFEDARAADHAAYARFFHAMFDREVYLPPSGYEAWFPSTAHGEAEVERTLAAAREAAKELATGGS